jgi:probable F420-dependent oxidoreductase
LISFGVHVNGSPENLQAFGELCRKIEDWGFDSIWLADGLTRNMLDPIPLLAHAASFTTRVKLGTCVYIVPLRNPLVTAKLTATLDRLSGGRLILGVGVGWRDDEFKAMGVPFEKRGQVADECLEILRQAWTTGTVNFQGEFFNIAGIRMELRPEQKPHPPIWVGGNEKSAAIRAARFSDFWIPTDYSVDEYRKGKSVLMNACKKISRDPESVKLASHLMMILDKSKSTAEAMAENVATSLHEKYDEFRRWAIVGDPSEVIRRINEYVEAGVDYHVLNFATKVRSEEQMELFAREVAPNIK